MCGFENEITEVKDIVEQMNTLVHLKDEGKMSQFEYITQFLSLKEKASKMVSELILLQAERKSSHVQ